MIQNSENVQRSPPLNANSKVLVNEVSQLDKRLFEQRPGATVVISDTGCWLFARKTAGRN
jgi:hypothetical protein